MDAAGLVSALHSEEGRHDPYTYYAALHEQGPACGFNSPVAGYDLVVHGIDAVDRVLRDPTFHLMDAAYEDKQSRYWRDHAALRTLKRSLFFMNGAGHLQVRLLFNQVFTARRVAALQPAIARLTEVQLDRVARLGADGSPVDFMSEFAFPLPSNVMGELIGVPDEDRAWYRPRARAIGDILDLDTITWRTMQSADRAAEELAHYFTDLVERRRADPRDDLMSALVAAQSGDAAWLEDEALFANLITVFNAGFVTTTQLFGHSVAILLRHPAALVELRAHPERAPAYIEEILRHEPPVHFVIRIASTDCEVAGVPVRAGSRALVLIGAANRDPARFVNPDMFDPNREEKRVITFGAGGHYCLGAALTRAEGALALPRLLDRFPALALAGEPGTPRNLTLRGYDALPVTVV